MYYLPRNYLKKLKYWIQKFDICFYDSKSRIFPSFLRLWISLNIENLRTHLYLCSPRITTNPLSSYELNSTSPY